jgi:hypothetical protein
MPIPITLNEKIGICIAVYGAIVATINSVVQFINYRRDRADVIVTVNPNMVSTDDMDRKITVIKATNRGKRPVRIEGIAARQLDRPLNLLFPNLCPQAPYELTESQSISTYIDQSSGGLAHVETYFAYDSLGREFVLHMVPWYRRDISKYRRRRSEG